jgi:hypothetical protein
MSAEAEKSNFDTERFIVEVQSRNALWDMTWHEWKTCPDFVGHCTKCRKYLWLIGPLILGVPKISCLYGVYVTGRTEKLKLLPLPNSISKLTMAGGLFGGWRKYSCCQGKRHQNSWWRGHGGLVWKRPNCARPFWHYQANREPEQLPLIDPHSYHGSHTCTH